MTPSQFSQVPGCLSALAAGTPSRRDARGAGDPLELQRPSVRLEGTGRALSPPISHPRPEIGASPSLCARRCLRRGPPAVHMDFIISLTFLWGIVRGRELFSFFFAQSFWLQFLVLPSSHTLGSFLLFSQMPNMCEGPPGPAPASLAGDEGGIAGWPGPRLRFGTRGFLWPCRWPEAAPALGDECPGTWRRCRLSPVSRPHPHRLLVHARMGNLCSKIGGGSVLDITDVFSTSDAVRENIFEGENEIGQRKCEGVGGKSRQWLVGFAGTSAAPGCREVTQISPTPERPVSQRPLPPWTLGSRHSGPFIRRGKYRNCR